jgi:hypothetical protein
MRVGRPFCAALVSELADPRYSNYLEWLHTPPNFLASSLNGADQRTTPPITEALATRIVYSDAGELNSDSANFGMRLYVDYKDPSNTILKISPHVSSISSLLRVDPYLNKLHNLSSDLFPNFLKRC